MVNTISNSIPGSDMFRRPREPQLIDTDPSEVVAAAEAIAQQAYIEAISAPDEQSVGGAEIGGPSRPVREGGAATSEFNDASPEQAPVYADRDGQPINQNSSAAVIAETANVLNSYAEEPEVRAAREAAERNYAAARLALTFGDNDVKLRNGFLTYQDVVNPASPLKKSLFGPAA